jgi:hypothetical protein
VADAVLTVAEYMICREDRWCLLLVHSLLDLAQPTSPSST